MIHFRINITLPLLLVVAFAVLAWLVRDSGSSAQARQSAPRRPRRTPRQTIIQPQRDGHATTYEEALRAPAGTYTADELRDLADRDAHMAALNAYSAASAAQIPNPFRKGAQS